ncbi:MAG: DNA-directed RNA polymerase subunit K [Candidatus Diapherotrites archaeon]|nr:DNA-directed RNA polymerase subunit K [Candidatus Diapherotrites archaeon]
MTKLTRFEHARIVSARALQISLGAPSKVKPSKDDAPTDIALHELEQHKVPLSVIRKYPTGRTELIEVD